MAVDTTREAVEALIGEYAPLVDPVSRTNNDVSTTCANGHHGWCGNRSPQESRCGCACHLKAFLESRSNRTLGMLRALLAERDSLQGAVARLTAGWQDMATAPKDGTWVLAYCGPYYGVIAWNSDMTWHTPTHWQPLPPPPAVSEGSGQ